MNNSDKWVAGTAIVVVAFALVVLTWVADWSLQPAIDVLLFIGLLAFIQYIVYRWF